MWKFMLNKDIGLVNTLLRLVGLDNLTHAWIGGEEHCARHGYCGKYLAVYWFYDGFILYCDDEYFQRCSGIRSG